MDLISLSYISIHLISALVGGLLCVVLIRKYRETNIFPLLLLGIFGFGYLFVNVNLLVPFVFPQVNYQLIGAIHSVVFVQGIILLIVFFNLFAGNLSIYRISYAAFISAAVIVLVLTALFYDFSILGIIYQEGSLLTFIWTPLPSFFISIGFIGLYIFGSIDLDRSLKFALSESQKTKILQMRVGFRLLIVSILISIPGFMLATLGNLQLAIWLSMILAWIPTMVGFFIIAQTYMDSSTLAFLQSQRIEVLLVINSNGLPLFTYEFRKDIMKSQTGLVSGAISAVRSLMAEAFQISTEIEQIVFQDRYVLVDIKKEISFLLVSSRPSSFISTALHSFSEEFVTMFNHELKNFRGDVTPYSKASELIISNFGL